MLFLLAEGAVSNVKSWMSHISEHIADSFSIDTGFEINLSRKEQSAIEIAIGSEAGIGNSVAFCPLFTSDQV